MTTNQGDETNVKAEDVALYNLTRASADTAALWSKSQWTIDDTASFDHMHYDAANSLIHCALELELKPYQRILDIGSGFNATGRFLADRFWVRVTGIELQKSIHEMAETITKRNVEPRVTDGVKSVNDNILLLTPITLQQATGGEEPLFDHVVSFLCILHLPASERGLLFAQAARFLKPGGRMYLEDFYDKSTHGMSAAVAKTLKETNQCPFLPTRAGYVSDVVSAGFEQISFEDVSEYWADVTAKKATEYKSKEGVDKDLLNFSEAVADLFKGGEVGGVRLTACKKMQ